jgi:polyisoprenoid-binding protein YceI
MTKSRVLLAAILIFAVALVAAGATWFYVLGDTEEASGPIESIPIDVSETETGSDAQVDSEASSESGAPSGSGAAMFAIVQTESEARFTLGEILAGQPKIVIGVTDQIAGEIAVDPEKPTEAQIGTIRVNARTLVTDNEFRNRAIRNRILETDAHEFITFTPAEITGLPESVSTGESFSIEVSGGLTIRQVTKQVTFAVNVTPISETRLEGLASTAIRYADYDITIPSVPRVAGVDDEVLLELDFVAAANE